MVDSEIIVTCPHCGSPNIDTDLDGYLSCMDCYWSEEEEEIFIQGMTDFYDHCEHGIPIDDDCDDCNEALAFQMGVLYCLNLVPYAAYSVYTTTYTQAFLNVGGANGS